ncbi:uncharacterized protein LOC119456511 isoform X2 [Dermacentor silvarum]|uniref:uncharacterized protein LOC119456511 isoform X2 n=1 Tax=Dermacentor silvarum TaxID=543639 RepID=UPI0021010D10|nr:uncharacterized protein LOC119456511 isoform X2 [Dermacentor silvarum]
MHISKLVSSSEFVSSRCDWQSHQLHFVNGKWATRASNSSPTTLLLLLVVPIVLVLFADFAFAVATKSSEAQAGHRAAVRTADTSSSGESASGGSVADAKVKDEGKTLMSRNSTAKAHTAQKKHDLVSKESATRRNKRSTGQRSRKSNKSYVPGGHQQRSTFSLRTTEVVYTEPSQDMKQR